MRWIIFTTLLIISNFIQGQHTISGKIVDQQDVPLIGSTVLLLEKSDSTIIEFCLTNNDGYFEFVGVEQGDYIIQSSYVAFKDLLTDLVTSWEHKEVDVGSLIMMESNAILTEIEVKAERIPMGINGDTISYDANAFKTRPNATVEDLLKKLPGIEVERDGNIKAQGEDVDKVLVDGKEFFGNDPKMATKNLQAEAVDKVQVFDKKSEIAEFTGVDDGNEKKTINLELKEDFKKGGFGQVELAKGNESTYDSKLNYFRFSPNLQASLIFARNNINKETFSINDRIAFMGGIGNFMSAGGFSNQGIAGLRDGINTSTSVGANFNVDFSSKLKLTSHYIYSAIDNDLLSNTIGKHLTDDLNYTSNRDEETSNSNANHQVNSKLTYEINPLTEVIFKNNLDWAASNRQVSQTGIYSRMQNVLGDTQLSSTNAMDNFSYDFKGILKRRFKKKGRSIIGDALLKFSDDSTIDNFQNTNTLINPFVNIDQFQDYQNKLEQREINLNYTEPLSKKTFFGISFTTASSQETPGRKYFDIVDNEKQFNSDLSSSYFKDYNFMLGGFSIRRNMKRVKLAAALRGQITNLNGEINNSESIEREYQNLLPSLSIDLRLKGGKKMDLSYSTNLIAPNLDQLMPLPDNRNPNFLYVGNPDLNPGYDHNIRYNFHLFSNFSLTSMFFSANATLSKNRIVNKIEVDQNLFTTATPVNTDKFRSINFHGSFSKPFRPLKIKYGIKTDVILSNYDSFLNGQASGITENNLNLKFNISNRNTDHVYVEAGVKLDRGNRKYSIDPSFNQSYNTWDYYLDTDFYLPFDFTFKSMLSYQVYSDNGFENSPEVVLWHLSLSKLLFKEKLEVKASVHDLFNQNIGYDRFGTATSILEKNFNNLGRYIMVGLNYKIGKNNKKSGIQIDME